MNRRGEASVGIDQIRTLEHMRGSRQTSVNNLLELIFKEIFDIINPLSDDWCVRLRIIDELRAVVGTLESFRGATVEPFGSFLSNLFTRWGDLDISIELSNGAHIVSPGRKHKLSILGDLHRACRAKAGIRRLQLVSDARVPILKFESPENISCDVSVNNLSGQMKSKFLLWISLIDPRFHDMVLLVKEWAKAHNINNSRAGTLNSYSLSLLVIFHFQTCRPAILPPLNEIYPANMAEELKGVRSVIEQQFEEVCTGNITRYKEARRINHSSLPELFLSFLSKFCNISERAEAQGISTFMGRWEDIDKNTRWLPRTYALFIEDPFDQPENTARSVSPRNLTKISEAFRVTHQILTSPNQTRVSLIPLLVRPQILSTLLPDHNHTRNNHWMGSQQFSRDQWHFNRSRPVNGSNGMDFRKPGSASYPRLAPPLSSANSQEGRHNNNSGVQASRSKPADRSNGLDYQKPGRTCYRSQAQPFSSGNSREGKHNNKFIQASSSKPVDRSNGMDFQKPGRASYPRKPLPLFSSNSKEGKDNNSGVQANSSVGGGRTAHALANTQGQAQQVWKPKQQPDKLVDEDGCSL